VVLVEALERSNHWERLAKYAALLFARAKDMSSFRLCVRSQFEVGDFSGVVQLSRAHEDFVARSDQLQSLLAWSLYNLGDVNACREIVGQL
jgi:hypothetical protein